jgi:hypothetical protein
VPRVSCLVSRVSCLVSRVSCLVSRVSCLVSRVSWLVARVSCLVSRVSCLVSRVSCLVSRFSLSPLPTHRCRNSDCAEHFDGSERQRAEEKCCARMNWTGNFWSWKETHFTVNFPERWHLIWLENGSGDQPGLYSHCVINRK